MTEVPANRMLYRGLGGMILPDQFWRTFEECQVSFCVQTCSKGQASAASRALRAAVLTSKRAVLDSKHMLETKVLTLKGFPAPGTVPQGTEMRVVCEAEGDGLDGVRMVIALPLSQYDFTAKFQARFAEAIGACCGVDSTNVVIEDVTNKPSDFKGAGYFSPAVIFNFVVL